MRGLLVILIILAATYTGIAQSEFASSGSSFSTLEEVVQVDLYPNPATEQINVRVSDNSAKKLVFQMHNIIGNKIQIQAEEISPGHYRIRLEDLTPGYYLLSVREEGKSKNKVHKFLKR